ncbi:hypothetical protein LEP1GSC016_2109 [Leptospira borgpetersenii serovar Hardjo-bovis str. Sponselee]|uniref:Uncharacterized protein n=1 Tax=Leptospira borgpetersenii serovar Hardjo-bovis str. Sponselee TaxID=1303729 RepID=M6BV89_LEPBO|nr:hypothetical protein LEP1GSC016_2109 [Leptospira borgpetersenii serovar Hardjo-bovis str. Sponselee]
MQVKSFVLVGTLGRMCVLDSYYFISTQLVDRFAGRSKYRIAFLACN